MTIERKQFTVKATRKKEDKDVNTKKLKRNFKVDTLADAIVDGKFVGEIGHEIVVSRFRNGKDTLSICTVKQVDEKGLVHTWDETLQQWFVFPVTESPKVTKLFSK
jgi:hypothetical protein